MRVLLISVNRESLPDPVAPLGAAYVASALKRYGHDVRLLDLQFMPDLAVSVKSFCRTFKPQAVGLSIRNVDNVAFPHSSSYLPDIKAAVDAVKSCGIKLIVPGGSGFTLMPAELLDALDLDLGIVGEGEETFPDLLKRVELRRPVNNLPGLAYRYNGQFRVNPPRKVRELDRLAEPDRGLIDNEFYMAEGGAGNLQTKRGCSFKCAYCTYPLVEGKKVRLRSPAKAAAEFERTVKEHGVRHIFIVDNVFNYPPEHAKAFCRELIKRRMGADWSCYLNPAFVDAELVRLMVKAGCKGAEFGTDSAVDTVLSALKKGFAASDVVRASRLCADAGLSYCHSLLLGAPSETADTVKRTLDAMDTLGPNAVIAMLGVRLFPNTALVKRARAEGVLGDAGIGLKPVFYFSPGLDIDRVLMYLDDYGREHHNFIMPGIHLRMSEKIRKRLRSYGFKGPLWEFLKA